MKFSDTWTIFNTIWRHTQLQTQYKDNEYCKIVLSATDLIHLWTPTTELYNHNQSFTITALYWPKINPLKLNLLNFSQRFPIGNQLEPSIAQFLRYWASKILRSWPWPFEVTWRHRSRDRWIHHIWFSIAGLLKPTRCLARLLRYVVSNP